MERKTSQREAIRQVLEEVGRPVSPQELHEAGRLLVPKLGMATVYRNLKALIEQGEVLEVELPGAPSRYELAGKHHHHHFHCRLCDRLFEVEACPGNLEGLAPPGFALESHEIILYGLCTECK